jgi:hypothetical protein
MILPVCQFIATACAALFAGAALYINVAEQPARLRLNTEAAVNQWAPSYHRATFMQAPLAIVSCLAGIAVWLLGRHAGWLVGAGLMGAVVPFTLIVIMPTNRELLSPRRDRTAASTRDLLVRWGRLHAVRTILSLAAAALDLALLA